MKRLKTAFVVLCVSVCVATALEHNLPEGVELVDPKDLGLDSQIDLDKLLGNVKALPIDGNALSSALGKPGLKTQVLTVGFDGSEGINLDDFELPQLKNDEHGPLAQAAFSSFKNFFKNSTSASQYDDQQQQETPAPLQVTTLRPGVKKRTMMRRRKVKVTTTTTQAPEVLEQPQSREATAEQSAPGPKVIELDSSQIEKLIASGKIGPPKSITPGGPQIIELGQRDLDALLNGENGEELKQILEGGEPVKDFDISQIPRNKVQGQEPQSQQQQIQEQIQQQIQIQQQQQQQIQQQIQQQQQEVEQQQQQQQQQQVSTPQPTTPTYYVPTVQANIPVPQPQQPENTSAPVPQAPQDNYPPIIYQYNSRDTNQNIQTFQSQVPLLQYQGSVNGQEQSKLVKHPTFDLISAPPVSFSTSVVSPNTQLRNTFISPEISSHFIPSGAPPSLNEVAVNKPFEFKTNTQKQPEVKNNNFIQNIHQVNLPVNSVKLVTPSPQMVQTLLSQVPVSFAPTSSPSHVVSSPVLDPLRVSNSPQFLPSQFSNTQLFSGSQKRPPPPPPPPARPSSVFRFPGGSPPNRFRTSETQNPHFSFAPAAAGGTQNLVLNSFVAGDGLNYRPSSSQQFKSPGI